MGAKQGVSAHNAIYNNPDFIGQRFGRLTVIGIEHNDNKKQPRWIWRCKCDCGNETHVRADYVYHKHSASCGCAVHDNKPNLKHGESKTRLYHIWKSIHSRCSPVKNKCNAQCHYRYGGRGIRVCEEWDDYENFARWARENGYREDLTIERINNDGNYCPENCRWASVREQTWNRRTTRYVTYQGRNMALAEACKIANAPYKTVFSRIEYQGWSFEKAISTPINATRKLRRFQRTCSVCGKEFISRSPGGRYCSKECHLAARRGESFILPNNTMKHGMNYTKSVDKV